MRSRPLSVTVAAVLLLLLSIVRAQDRYLAPS